MTKQEIIISEKALFNIHKGSYSKVRDYYKLCLAIHKIQQSGKLSFDRNGIFNELAKAGWLEKTVLPAQVSNIYKHELIHREKKDTYVAYLFFDMAYHTIECRLREIAKDYSAWVKMDKLGRFGFFQDGVKSYVGQARIYIYRE